MDNLFDSFKQRIMQGLKNRIPVESKLIILGEIIYAVERRDLIPKQARELEELLDIQNAVEDYAAIREKAIFGELIEEIQV
ncbi:MAG: hypothetical protein PUP92_02775 [Rhizonema sp. PD38]|nr:hypothetical protein [Rhizonema sp. PD38]